MSLPPKNHSETNIRSTPREPTLELVMQAKDGDPSAWEAIDFRYREALMRIAHGRAQGELRRRFDTEDLVQSTLADAHSAISKFQHQGPGSLQGWLVCILNNRWYQELRRHTSAKRDARREVVFDSEVAFDSEAPWDELESMSAGEAIIRAEQHTIFMNLISRLPEEEGYILRAIESGKKSIADLAVELGVSEATVRRRKAKALLWLRKNQDSSEPMHDGPAEPFSNN